MESANGAAARWEGDRMSGRLQELRVAAGYDTAKDFASAIGVPPTTYSRYESQPDRIPLRAAWQLADFLGVTIDQVVGRDDGPQGDPRGGDQRAIDALSERSRAEARDFVEFLAQRDRRDREAGARRATARWDAIAMRIEQFQVARLAEGDGRGPDPLLLTGTDGDLRDNFVALAGEWVLGSERPLNPDDPVTGQAALDAVTAAYDRAHARFGTANAALGGARGTMDVDGVTVDWEERDGRRRETGGR